MYCPIQSKERMTIDDIGIDNQVQINKKDQYK